MQPCVGHVRSTTFCSVCRACSAREEANEVEHLDFYGRDTDRVGHEDKEYKIDEQMHRCLETPAQQETAQVDQHERQNRDKHVMMSDDDECVDNYPAWL